MQTLSDILMLPVEGDLDAETAPRVRAYLEGRVRRGCRRVIMNLANTSHIDSVGVGLILGMARLLRSEGGLLSLVNVSPAVYRSLVICRLVDFIPVSGAAPKPPIPALDPSVRPLWRATMCVDADRLAYVRQRLDRLLHKTSLAADEIFDFTLACGEALGNAVDHTCAEGVLVTGSIYPDRVVVEVTDCGEGFELAPGELPPAGQGEGGDGCCCERGRGIKLMRLLADSVEIEHKASGSGTVVRLVKMYTPNALEPGR